VAKATDKRTDKQTDRQTDKQTDEQRRYVKLPLCGGSFTSESFLSAATFC